MSEFTYLFRGRKYFSSPEQAQQHIAKWTAWFKELDSKGFLKNPGLPLEPTGKVVGTSGTKKTVKDGPYAEAKDVVGGFIVVEAQDITEAAEIAKDCPILDVGGFVEVRPVERRNQ